MLELPGRNVKVFFTFDSETWHWFQRRLAIWLPEKSDGVTFRHNMINRPKF